MSTELKEATLEALRVCLLAVIPVAIDSLSAGSLNLRTLLVVALIALLKFMDKYLHQVGKADGNESLARGLTRF